MWNCYKQEFFRKLSLLLMEGVVPHFPSFLPPFLRGFSSKAAGPPKMFSKVRLGWASLCLSMWCWSVCAQVFTTSVDVFAKFWLFSDLSASFLLGPYNGFNISVYGDEPFILCPASFLGCSAAFCPVSFFSSGIIGNLTTFIEFLQDASSWF